MKRKLTPNEEKAAEALSMAASDSAYTLTGITADNQTVADIAFTAFGVASGYKLGCEAYAEAECLIRVGEVFENKS